ncbi:MAG: hypothetical protein GY861_21915 [bacterium]|nr:hypothetical protein [bacterium]
MSCSCTCCQYLSSSELHLKSSVSEKKGLEELFSSFCLGLSAQRRSPCVISAEVMGDPPLHDCSEYVKPFCEEVREDFSLDKENE